MSFQTITTAEITTGEPVKNTTQTKIKDNFDNLDTRVTSLEGGGSTIYPPIIFRVNGDYGDAIDFDVVTQGLGILKTTLNFGIVITGVRILIDKAGSSGITELDLKYKRGVSSYTSIFNTLPSVSYTAGDDSISSNAVINPSGNTLEAGDILRLDLTQVQNMAKNFIVRVDYFKN